MCDPLSVTGSVIAVVTVAAQSCDALCTFFRSCADTAEYLKHYISILEGLKAIFAGIAELDREASHHFTFNRGLLGRLEECGLHVQAIEKIVLPSHNKLQMSKADRLWTKMKWSTTSQRQKIDKLMIRIESHCNTFVMSLLLLNTRLVSRSNSEAFRHSELINLRTILSKLNRMAYDSQKFQRSTRCSGASESTYGRIDSEIPSTAKRRRGNLLGAQSTSCQSPHKIKQIRKAVTVRASRNAPRYKVPRACETHFVDSGCNKTGLGFSERGALSFRTYHVENLERGPMSILCWIGHANRKECSDEKKLSSAVVQVHSGYAIGLVISSCWCLALRLELLLYMFVRPGRRGIGISFGCDLKFPSVITWDSETVALCLRGDVERMKMKFAAAEANPFDILPNGSTLLHLAAMRNHFEMVKFLIRQGAPLNSVDEFGDTPLHRCLELATDYNISRILIENGADLCNRNADGKTPLHIHFNLVVERVLLIHADLPDYSIRDDCGKTVLHHLVWSSTTSRKTFERVSTRSERMKKMLDREHKSLLHHAAQRGNLAILESILAQSGQNVNIKDKFGRTPLHYAIESSRAQKTIELLVSNGADTSARDYGGLSALDIAAQRGKKPAIWALKPARKSRELSTETAGYCEQTHVQAGRKSGAQNALQVMTSMIKLQRRDWRVNNLTSGFGTAVSVVDMDIEGLSKAMDKKDQQHLSLYGSPLSEQLSRLFTPIIFEVPRKASKVFLHIILLYGIWLLVHAK